MKRQKVKETLPPIAVDDEGRMYRPVTARKWLVEAAGENLGGLLKVAAAGATFWAIAQLF